MANYRNRKLLQQAQHHECQYCGADDGTIVAAHSNQLIHGKGLGLKAHDVFIAYLCDRDHSIVDGRSHPNTPQETRELIWTTAHQRTINLPQVRRLLDPEALRLLGESA